MCLGRALNSFAPCVGRSASLTLESFVVRFLFGGSTHFVPSLMLMRDVIALLMLGQ